MKFGMNPSPYFRSKRSTTQIMLEFGIGLLLVWICGIVYYFTLSVDNGIRAIINPIVCMLVALVTECLFMLPKHIKEKGTFKDLLFKLFKSYGYISGLILGLLFPVGTAFYAIIITTIFAIAVSKMLFGGFGYNIFNVAIVGRVFAQTVFLSKMKYDATISTGATIITQFGATNWSLETLSKAGLNLSNLLLGNYYSALGETFTLVFLIIGVIYAIRKVIDWRAPVFYVATIYISTFFMGLVAGYGINSFEFALVQILTGGIIFGAVFCLTDPVTTPTSPAGKIIFGVGTAVFTLLIRYLGAAQSGVAFSILIMNALTPLIDSSIKGLSNQFTKRKLITTCVLGAIAITSGCVTGAMSVDKAGFVNAQPVKACGIKSNVKKLSEENGISKYQVEVSGYLGENLEKKIVKLTNLFSNDDLGSFNDYFNTYSDVEYTLTGGSSKMQSLYISYVDENGDKQKEDTGLYISYTKNEDTKTWMINSSSGEDYNFDTKYTSETDIFETNVKNGDVYISFATSYTASEKTAASYVSVKYNVSLDYAKKEIVSTEYISSGAGGGYGDVLLSENGGDASKYSMTDPSKAVEFYNNYIKIDSPKKFEEFTKVSYDTFRDVNNYKDEDFVIHVGATYTAIGYITVMQRVIEYANAEHTLGKVKA